MRISDLSSHMLSFSMAEAMLAACGGSQPPTGAPGANTANLTNSAPSF